MFEGDVRTQHVEHVRLSDSADGHVVVGVVIRSQKPGTRMLLVVRVRHSDYRRIVVDHRGVARRQLPSEYTLSAEQRFGEGAVDLGDEDLVVAATCARENQRRPTNAEPRIVASHPVRLISGRYQELRGGRWGRRQSASPRKEGQRDGDQKKQSGVSHRSEIYRIEIYRIQV